MGLFEAAETREAAWFTTDPPAGWGVNPPPPLVKAAGGSFDVVQAFGRRVARIGRSIYIVRENTVSERIATGERAWNHHMRAMVLWNTDSRSGVETDQQRFMTALGAIEARIRGPLLDKTHGGQFFQSGEEGDVHFVVRPWYEDEKSLRAEVHWMATDVLVG